MENWLTEAIELEATPKAIRTESVREFCARLNVNERTYYYQTRKPEFRAQVLELALNEAKREAPDVLRKLAERAKGGDVKAIDIYLDYILKLAKNLDLKSDGKSIVFVPTEIADKNALTLDATHTSAEPDSA